MSGFENALARAREIRLRAVERVCRAWNSAGLPYAVLHGLEEYPVAVGRDLDVMIPRECLEDVLRVTCRCLEVPGCAVRVHRRAWAVWVVAFDANGDVPVGIEIDLMWEMRWSWTRLLDFDRIASGIDRKGGICVSVEGTFIKTVLFPYLGGCLDKARANLAMLSGQGQGRTCRDMLLKSCGASLAQRILNDLEREQVEKRPPRLWPARGALLLHGLKEQGVGRTLLEACSWLRAQIGEVAAPAAAPVIALVGPDGVGKTTLIRQLAATLPVLLASAGVAVRHWRPGILPPLAWWRGGRVAQTPAAVPRREAGRLSWLRAAYYSCDCVLGHFFRDRVAAGRLKVVLYDRHVLDMQVDPVRYGIADERWPRYFFRFVPRPGATIALVAAPDVVAARKQELPLDEVQRQIAAWEKMLDCGLVSEIVHTDGGCEDTLKRLIEIIVRMQLALGTR